MSKIRCAHGELFVSYPDVVDVETLCEMLGGISKKLAYRLLGRGQIRCIKIGRSYKIPKIFIAEYLLEEHTLLRWISNE